MRIVHRPVASGLLFLTLLAAAHAADGGVYRCGQTYQQVPCEEGQAIDASDSRTAAQRREAQAAVKSDQQQAKERAAERREREKAIKPQREPLATGVRPVELPASAPAPAGHPPKKKNGKGKSKPEIEDPQYLAPPKVTDGK